MAGYHDPYDSRSRPAGRNDPYSRQYVPSNVGHASSGYERVGEVNDRYQPQPQRPQRHDYDPRNYPPPPPPLGAGRYGPPPRSPTTRGRHSWPPRVTCEDEVVSLSKEAGSASLLKAIGRDEAPSRGTIDQEPIVQPVPELMSKDERRYILVSDSEREGRSTGMPTPPTSEDERVRRPVTRPSRLKTAMQDGTPELQKRTASPYAYTKPTKLNHDMSSNEQFLSPTTSTPPSIDNSYRRKDRFASSKPSSPRRESPRVSPSARKGRDYFDTGRDSGSAITDDDDPRSTRSGASKSSKDSYTSSIPDRTFDRTSVHDFAPPSTNAPPIRRLNLDARRNTDNTGGFPTLPSFRVDSSQRPAPIVAASALGAVAGAAIQDAPPPRSRESSYVSSRGVSPGVPSTGPSPSSSVRPTTQSSNPSRPTSAHSSAAVSASPSRPASPSPKTPAETARLPRTDNDWSTLLAANAARKAKPPSRLATQMRQESVPDVPQLPYSAGPGPRNAASLPYPDDPIPGTPTMYMPSERDHQYFAPHKPSLNIPLASEGKDASRNVSPAPSNASRTSTASRNARPVLARGHSIANPAATEERPAASRAARHDSFGSSSQTKKEIAALLKKKLPDCPRSEPVAGYDDWYTVIGAPNLAFCPDCVDSVFERTIYRPSIRRLPQLDFKLKIGCAFGSSAWLRLAWLLTLQQQKTDLQLLKDLADIEDSGEICPGSQEAVRSWYGLRDSEGYFVRDFQVCYSDVRKVERLLPTLNGLFVRLPHRDSYGKYACAIRTDSNRFSAYLDGLILAHENAHKTRQGPDPMPFVELVEHKLRLRECTRDNMLIGGLWHFIPNIPSLTVCEDCYESIVEPEVKKNSDLAMRFNRSVQPVYGEGMGSSCYLYSRRMRKVFQRAVEDGDAKYLARKAKERREAELRLQERYKELRRRAKRLSYEGTGDEEDERRLNRELERITDEWQSKWE
ncbi:hypothetical protein LTR86_007474 [Recurvomyces mirabilis]|nr:hypothetical protein LTR86_007474 [Recurvomyces mirabilis]